MVIVLACCAMIASCDATCFFSVSISSRSTDRGAPPLAGWSCSAVLPSPSLRGFRAASRCDRALSPSVPLRGLVGSWGLILVLSAAVGTIADALSCSTSALRTLPPRDGSLKIADVAAALVGLSVSGLLGANAVLFFGASEWSELSVSHSCCVETSVGRDNGGVDGVGRRKDGDGHGVAIP